MNAPLARVVSISKTLGSTRALDDVSLEVRGGDIVGLLGANGAGKTTLMRILVGLIRPDAGYAWSREAARIAYLPEERGLYQRRRVAAVLAYLAEIRGIEKSAISTEVEHVLARVGMAEFGGRRVEHLSKGQQQKVQLGAALIGSPDLLVLDEPFAGLDPLNARLVCDIAREAAANDRGVLLSAHQLTLVEQTCTHVAMLAGGRIVVSGAIEKVREAGQSLDAIFEAQVGRRPWRRCDEA